MSNRERRKERQKKKKGKGKCVIALAAVVSDASEVSYVTQIGLPDWLSRIIMAMIQPTEARLRSVGAENTLRLYRPIRVIIWAVGLTCGRT